MVIAILHHHPTTGIPAVRRQGREQPSCDCPLPQMTGSGFEFVPALEETMTEQDSLYSELYFALIESAYLITPVHPVYI